MMKKQYLEPRMRVCNIEDGSHFLCASQAETTGAKIDPIGNENENAGFGDVSSNSNSNIWHYYDE